MKSRRLFDICQSIQSLIDLWIDEDAIERGPDVEIDLEQDHPFDAVDSDHPCEVDAEFDYPVAEIILICMLCGNTADCCAC
jgi:hypothetical protein